MRWAGLLILLASPALAKPALISFEFAEGTIVANGADIEVAEPAFDWDNQPVVRVDLHKGFDARFGALSVKSIDRVMTVRICGEIVSQPMVKGMVSLAKFQITAGSVEDARRLAEQLQTQACPEQPQD